MRQSFWQDVVPVGGTGNTAVDLGDPANMIPSDDWARWIGKRVFYIFTLDTALLDADEVSFIVEESDDNVTYTAVDAELVENIIEYTDFYNVDPNVADNRKQIHVAYVGCAKYVRIALLKNGVTAGTGTAVIFKNNLVQSVGFGQPNNVD